MSNADIDQRLRIMVVDDDPHCLAGLAAMMQKGRGWAVVAAVTTGHEAIERYVHDHPDVVLLDVNLGDMAMSEVVRRLHALDPAVKILLNSGLRTRTSSLTGWVLVPPGSSSRDRFLTRCGTLHGW